MKRKESDPEVLLDIHLAERCLQPYYREYKFDPTRRWRIDFAWPQCKLAVEIEGGVWVGGRHTRGMGFVGDIEKYNALTMKGWYLLRFTPKDVNNMTAVNTICKFIAECNI